MFYDLEMVQLMGFDTLDHFIEDFVSHHNAPMIMRFRKDLVYADYDVAYEPACENIGHMERKW